MKVLKTRELTNKEAIERIKAYLKKDKARETSIAKTKKAVRSKLKLIIKNSLKKLDNK